MDFLEDWYILSYKKASPNAERFLFLYIQIYMNYL